MASEGGDHLETNAYKPCAHCKVQRLRNCGPTCKMAPYFPAEKLRDFKNAQRLFGVRSIKKMIDEVEEEEERQAAADSILFEGNARRAHPSFGSYGVLLEQRKEFATSIRELEAVRKLVNDCKKMAGDLSPEQRVEALLLANGLSGRGRGALGAMDGIDQSEQSTLNEDADIKAFKGDLEEVDKVLKSFEQAIPGKRLDKSVNQSSAVKGKRAKTNTEAAEASKSNEKAVEDSKED